MYRITKLWKLQKQSLINLLYWITWCWAALKWPLNRIDQGTVLSSIFRVQTPPLSPHYEHKSLVSLETWGNSCTWLGISYCTFTTQSRPHLWKNHLQVSSSEIFNLLFFSICNKILKILVSVSSVDVPFPGLHSVILHVFPWCPCHTSLTAQLLGF